MSMHDEDTPRYLAGFHSAVRHLLGPKENGWSSAHYTDEAAIEQALRRAYHEGRIDGISWALGPSRAPGAVDVDGQILPETREQAWERLELFDAPAEPPVLTVPVMEPLDDDPFAWAIRQARTNLGLSLIEADEFVMGVMG